MPLSPLLPLLLPLSALLSHPSGMRYRILSSGDPSAKSPTASTLCAVHYEGKLSDGTLFDSSYSRGQPSVFTPNAVIRGLTHALQDMKPGDRWQLFIPPELGYGEQGMPPKIPPNAPLVFTLELIWIRSSSKYTIFGVDFTQPGSILKLIALAGLLIILFLAMSTGHAGKPPQRYRQSACYAMPPDLRGKGGASAFEYLRRRAQAIPSPR